MRRHVKGERGGKVPCPGSPTAVQGGRTGGLPGGGEELQGRCGVRSRWSWGRGGAASGQGTCINLSSEARKILQLQISVSFILTFT